MQSEQACFCTTSILLDLYQQILYSKCLNYSPAMSVPQLSKLEKRLGSERHTSLSKKHLSGAFWVKYY